MINKIFDIKKINFYFLNLIELQGGKRK